MLIVGLNKNAEDAHAGVDVRTLDKEGVGRRGPI